MSFKTILTIIQDNEGAERVCGCACAIAERFGAHLIGLHAETLPVPYVSAIGFPDTELIEATAEANRERTQEIAAIFTKATSDAGVDAEWQSLESFSSDPTHAGIAVARCSDLVIASQAAPEGPAPDIGALLFDAGRPVLVLPHDAPCLSSFRCVIVAWNGSREAARAAFDALPFIIEAERTEILCIDPADADGAAAPGADIAAALARHGADVTVHTEESAGRSADQVIVDRLAATGADLVVLGAYSHSWLRELIFGGVTRTAVQSMPVTTFLSR
jgi:nucleotide-binding universal stress UspA family protein